METWTSKPAVCPDRFILSQPRPQVQSRLTRHPDSSGPMVSWGRSCTCSESVELYPLHSNPPKKGVPPKNKSAWNAQNVFLVKQTNGSCWFQRRMRQGMVPASCGAVKPRREIKLTPRRLLRAQASGLAGVGGCLGSLRPTRRCPFFSIWAPRFLAHLVHLLLGFSGEKGFPTIEQV